MRISCFITAIPMTQHLDYCYQIRHHCIVCSESKGQSAAMPACTLAFASLCLQNALLLLKSAEVIPAHEPESVLESQVTKDDESLGQETDALRYVK